MDLTYFKYICALASPQDSQATETKMSYTIKMTKIGVFDSGIGGKTVANSLELSFPDTEIIYAADSEHVPYGNRSAPEIIELTDTAIQPLLDQHCSIIVLACNTATAVAIETLRDKYPSTTFIGLEPMIKPASNRTRSGIIAVCATPSTLTSARYKRLKVLYAQNITVVEPDCSNWAALIERNKINMQIISRVTDQVNASHADVVVLACTHYHWIQSKIEELLHNGITVINPSDAITRRIANILHMQ